MAVMLVSEICVQPVKFRWERWGRCTATATTPASVILMKLNVTEINAMHEGME
jgi:hypothetical protein